MTMRICFVVNAVGETSVPADIATALVEHTDVEVDILAWFGADGFEGDDAVGVTVVDAPDTTFGADRSSLARARDALDGYDVVQAHHNHSGSFAKVIASRLGIPTVSREGNMRKGFNRLGRIANGLTNPLADRVVCNSRAVYDSFRRWETALLPREKVAFIPNGVDFERLEAGRSENWRRHSDVSVESGSILVGTAGMLTEQKDQPTLLRAVARARTQLECPLELVIAGDGPRRSALRRLARDLGIDDAVHVLGLLDRREVYAMLYAIDIYAMPSLWEGFSAAAVEGIATENAAVFSDIPPFREPYDDVARFHPVGDHETLASHLVDLATDHRERDRLARAGRALAEERYSIDRVATAYRNLYETVADS